MLYACIISLVIVAYIMCDVNYFLRTLSTVLFGRLFDKKCALSQTTTIYGICTFQDVNLYFKRMRLSRVIRELDFGRFHFYDCTGIYDRSMRLKIRSLQGSTLVLRFDHIPMFSPYKIITKLVYWDDRSLFFEHEVITLADGKLCGQLVSRQYALTQDGGYEITALLKGLSGYTESPSLPEYIEKWLYSMSISSQKLRREQ